VLKQATGSKGSQAVAASHTLLGERYLYCDGDVPLLFTENETNNQRIFGTANAGPYVKDGINNYVINGSRMRSTRRTQGQKLPPLSGQCGCRKNRHDPSAAQ